VAAEHVPLARDPDASVSTLKQREGGGQLIEVFDLVELQAAGFQTKDADVPTLGHEDLVIRL